MTNNTPAELPPDIDVLHDPKLQLIQKGSLQYIADMEGTLLSEGFHRFRPFEVNDPERNVKIQLLLGQLGSQTYVIGIPEKPDETFEKVSEGCHDLMYRRDLGMLVSSLGALTTLVNNEGQPISQGYHGIYQRDGKLYGEIGARTEEIRLGVLELVRNYQKNDEGSDDEGMSVCDFESSGQQAEPKRFGWLKFFTL